MNEWRVWVQDLEIAERVMIYKYSPNYLDTLRMAYFALKKEAAPGVDGETWRPRLAARDRRSTSW